jgi:hypothetical protein
MSLAPRARPGRACSAVVLAVVLAWAGACKGREAGQGGKPGDGRSAPGLASPAGDGAPPAPASDKIEGTLTLDGRPLELVACRPGRVPRLHVDLVTRAGALRFVSGEDARMFWNPRPDTTEAGAPLDCSIPHRSWGGGTRADGTAYFRGELAFSCRGAPGVFEGKVSLDCGDIRSFERQGLDQQRQERREAQGLPATP